MAVSASYTNGLDMRDRGLIYPVWRRRATFTWATGDGHAAQTVTIAGLNGLIQGVVISISEVTGNPTVNVTLADDLSGQIGSFATLADGTVHIKDSSDFDNIPVACNVVISVDPSADPGGVTQTLTVIVELRGT